MDLGGRGRCCWVARTRGPPETESSGSQFCVVMGSLQRLSLARFEAESSNRRHTLWITRPWEEAGGFMLPSNQPSCVTNQSGLPRSVKVLILETPHPRKPQKQADKDGEPGVSENLWKNKCPKGKSVLQERFWLKILKQNETQPFSVLVNECEVDPHTVTRNTYMSQASLKKLEIFPERLSHMTKNCCKNLGITIFSFSSKYYKNQKETKETDHWSKYRMIKLIVLPFMSNVFKLLSIIFSMSIISLFLPLLNKLHI